jgi:hypothetical protein
VYRAAEGSHEMGSFWRSGGFVSARVPSPAVTVTIIVMDRTGAFVLGHRYESRLSLRISRKCRKRSNCGMLRDDHTWKVQHLCLCLCICSLGRMCGDQSGIEDQRHGLAIAEKTSGVAEFYYSMNTPSSTASARTGVVIEVKDISRRALPHARVCVEGDETARFLETDVDGRGSATVCPG